LAAWSSIRKERIATAQGCSSSSPSIVGLNINVPGSVH
jgi:hypothetical protein